MGTKWTKSSYCYWLKNKVIIQISPDPEQIGEREIDNDHIKAPLDFDAIPNHILTVNDTVEFEWEFKLYILAPATYIII